MFKEMSYFDSLTLEGQIEFASALMNDPRTYAMYNMAESDGELSSPGEAENSEEYDGIDLLDQPIMDQEPRKKRKSHRYGKHEFITGEALENELCKIDEDSRRRRKNLTLNSEPPLVVSKGAFLEINGENFLVSGTWDTGLECQILLEAPFFENENRLHPNQFENIEVSNDVMFIANEKEVEFKNLAPNQWLVEIKFENGDGIQPKDVFEELFELCGEQGMDACVREDTIWISSVHADVGQLVDLLIMQGDLEKLLSRKFDGFCFLKPTRKIHTCKSHYIAIQNAKAKCQNCGRTIKNRTAFETHLKDDASCAAVYDDEINLYKALNDGDVDNAKLDVARSIHHALGKAKGKYRAATGMPMQKENFLSIFGYEGYDPSRDDVRRKITDWGTFRSYLGNSSLLWHRKRNRNKKVAVGENFPAIISLQKCFHATGNYHFFTLTFGMDCT